MSQIALRQSSYVRAQFGCTPGAELRETLVERKQLFLGGKAMEGINMYSCFCYVDSKLLQRKS